MDCHLSSINLILGILVISKYFPSFVFVIEFETLESEITIENLKKLLYYRSGERIFPESSKDKTSKSSNSNDGVDDDYTSVYQQRNY